MEGVRTDIYACINQDKWHYSQQQCCVHDLTSADARLQMGHTTAEKSKSIMAVQMTVAVALLIYYCLKKKNTYLYIIHS